MCCKCWGQKDKKVPVNNMKFSFSQGLQWPRSLQAPSIKRWWIRLQKRDSTGREGERLETVQSDCSCPLYFILFYKLHCLPLAWWIFDRHLLLHLHALQLGSVHRNSSREPAVPALSPTLPVLPEVLLDVLRREREGLSHMSKRVFPAMFLLSFFLCTCRRLLHYSTHAGRCVWSRASKVAVRVKVPVQTSTEALYSIMNNYC